MFMFTSMTIVGYRYSRGIIEATRNETRSFSGQLWPALINRRAPQRLEELLANIQTGLEASIWNRVHDACRACWGAK